MSIFKAEATHFIDTRYVGFERRTADSYVILYLEVGTRHLCLPSAAILSYRHIYTFILEF